MIGGVLLLGALALFQASPAPPDRVGFAEEAISAHLASGEPVVEVATGGRGSGGEVRVRMTIAPDGAVTDAQVDRERDSGAENPAPALAAARALRFRPFTYRGAPVTAVGIVTIRYTPRGVAGWRNPNAALPPIDYAHLKITLIRSACFGSCPDYRVTIDGAGNVVFTTDADSVPGEAEVHRAYSMGGGVLVTGTHRTTISRAALDGLIERFRAAHFFGLRAQYRAGMTDNPTYVVGFESGGQRWEVEDYVGQAVGMPASVSALEDAIDETAGTAQWVSGDARTVPALIAAGLDPKSEQAAELVIASLMIYRANGKVALDLIGAGLPLDQRVTRPDGTSLPLDAAMRELMARGAWPRAFAMLATHGWPPNLTPQERDALFVKSGGGCDIDVARAMIAAGARINAVLDMSDGNDHRDTVLENVTARYGPCSDVRDRKAYVSALIGLGADPNLRDNLGRTAIFGVDDADMLELLLAAGARADITGNDSRSAVFFAGSDAVILRLLEAGADPTGRFQDRYGRADHAGKRLREAASDGDMPATLAWLDAHGAK